MASTARRGPSSGRRRRAAAGDDRPGRAPAAGADPGGLDRCGLLLLWQLAALLAGDPRLLPTPAAVLHAIVAYTASGELPYHLGVTLLRVAASFVIAMAIGTAIGIAMGRAPLFDRIAQPWLVFFLNLPALVTIVLAYIWIGLVESAADLRGRAQQDPERRGHRARGRPRARPRPARDGRGVPGRPAADPAARRAAAALPLPRRRRPLRASP